MARATVVIPSFNRASMIRATVEAALSQADEVLVVDDASPDGTADVAQEAGARVLTVTARSAAHARNVGWKAARNDVVLFTDAGAVPRAGWADRMLAAFDDPEVQIAGGAIGSHARGRFAKVYERMYDALDARQFHDGSWHLPGMNLAARKPLYDRVHFRDELPGAQCEDVDFLKRAADLGIRARFVPDAIVDHDHPASFDGLVEQEFRHGMGRARLVALHPELRRFWHTDAAWKWLLMSTLGSPVHVVWALRHARRADVPLVAMHVLRMAVGDYGYLQGVRALRREAARRAVRSPTGGASP